MRSVNVTVPAGTYEAFAVELKNMDGEPGGGTVYLDKNSRCVVRSVMQLPPMMGGGTVTSELQSVE